MRIIQCNQAQSSAARSSRCRRTRWAPHHPPPKAHACAHGTLTPHPHTSAATRHVHACTSSAHNAATARQPQCPRQYNTTPEVPTCRPQGCLRRPSCRHYHPSRPWTLRPCCSTGCDRQERGWLHACRRCQNMAYVKYTTHTSVRKVLQVWPGNACMSTPCAVECNGRV